MSAHVIRADSGRLPLPDASVDLIVTSPPYFGLRSYTDGGEHYAGQVGDEDTPTAYLDRLIACTAEWMRVLKPSGSIFVNLGDSYYSGKGAPVRTTVDAKSEARTSRRLGGNPLDGPSFGIRQKSLCGLPWRYAIRCVDELGLIQRAEIIWSKPNGLPESVTDRVRRSHEQVFHFTKQGRYFSGVDEIREEHVGGQSGKALTMGTRRQRADSGDTQHRDRPEDVTNPLGKLPGSVWTIPTAPLKVPASLGVDHFAAYPPELVRRIVLGWSPREVCTACGEGRRPCLTTVRTFDGQPIGPGTGSIYGDERKVTRNQGVGNWRFGADRTITGSACACPDTSAAATAGVVLDPFGGTGTTALVAACYGRTGLSVDLSHDYSRLARWRTRDGAERARVLGVEKPAEQIDGQGDLFGDAA